MAFPTGTPASHAGLYSVWITPPTGDQFQQVVLTCGWHTGGCDSPSEDGPALDWDTPDNTVWAYFRGGFKRSGLSSPTKTLLKKHVHQVQYGSDICDVTAADLWENLVGWPPRFGMHYYHVKTDTIIAWFEGVWVDGTSDGYFGSYTVSYAIPDSGANCPWNGPNLHVHDQAVLGPPPNGLPGYNRRLDVVPKGDYCPPAPCNHFGTGNGCATLSGPAVTREQYRP